MEIKIKEAYVLITSAFDKKVSGDFTIFKVLQNEKIMEEYTYSTVDLLSQLTLDIPRQNVYLDDIKITDINLIRGYIKKHPFLHIDKLLVYLFLCQTILSIPVIMLSTIVQYMNKDYIISEPKDPNKTEIYLYSESVIVHKKLRAVFINNKGSIHTKMLFDISLECDLAVGETIMCINGKFY